MRRFADLEFELAVARASDAGHIAALEARVRAAEAHIVDEAAAGKKRLVDFETELVENLADLCAAYERNIQSIGGLCSPLSRDEPSITDYMHWLAAEVVSLPEVFARVNENFISARIECALVMARDSVNLATL
jgi:hypothetical protein